jgi:hypothetical protein
VLVRLSVGLRPRFGRIDRTAYEVTRAQAPTLFGLIDRVANGAGVRPPHG